MTILLTSVTIHHQSQYSTNTPSSSATNSLEKNSRQKNIDRTLPNENVGNGRSSPLNTNSMDANSTPMLNEDYAELGMCEEEGDYSTPASKYKQILLILNIFD